jgi:hypothetical protein
MASGDILAVFTPYQNEPPASAFATLDTRNGYPVLDFDPTTDEEAIFRGYMPSHYSGGGVTATVVWTATDVTVTPHNAVWQGAFLSVTDDADDLDTKSFASFQSSGAVGEGSASGEPVYDTIAFTNGAQMDSVAVNEMFFFKLRRDADNTSATDSLTDDAEVWMVVLKET